MDLSGMHAKRILAGSIIGAAVVAAAGCSSGSNSSPGTTITVTTPAPSSASVPTSVPTSPPVSVPATASNGTGGVAGARPCTTSGLHVGTGSTQGAAGTSFTRIVFTNISGSSCTLGGFPGASLVTSGSDAGSQIGAAAKRSATSPARTVTLGAGEAAHAVLGVAVAGNFPAGKCRPVSAHWLKIFPPNQRAAAYTPLSTQTCASASVRTMTISPVRAGP